MKYVFYLLLLASVANSHSPPFKICRTLTVNATYITFTLFTNSNPVNGSVLTNDFSAVKSTVETIFIIHGWLESEQQGWVIAMKDKYLLKDVNVIVVGWSRYASCLNYIPSANAVEPVGVIVGNLVYSITVSGRSTLNGTAINGFSLGAHVAGIAGQQTQLRSGGYKIGRINGLEASGLLFGYRSKSRKLDASDANLVQAFHTCLLGLRKPYGTVDIYFNNIPFSCGSFQPGCPFNPGVPVKNHHMGSHLFCNQMRATAYYIDSINNPNTPYLATGCSSCFQFTSKMCMGQIYTIGEDICRTIEPGQYYLNTRCEAPFSMGNKGVIGGVSEYLCS